MARECVRRPIWCYLRFRRAGVRHCQWRYGSSLSGVWVQKMLYLLTDITGKSQWMKLYVWATSCKPANDPYFLCPCFSTWNCVQQTLHRGLWEMCHSSRSLSTLKWKIHMKRQHLGLVWPYAYVGWWGDQAQMTCGVLCVLWCICFKYLSVRTHGAKTTIMVHTYCLSQWLHYQNSWIEDLGTASCRCTPKIRTSDIGGRCLPLPAVVAVNAGYWQLRLAAWGWDYGWF